MAVFVGGGMAVAMALYWSAALFANRTTMSIAGGLLRVRHAPLWWPGNGDVPADQLACVFCEERAYRGGAIYAVGAFLRDGGRVILARGIPELAHARAIEDALARRLGIPGSS